MKFNANLIEYIETESVEWCDKLNTEGLLVSFPNKGRLTKKTYDQLQVLEVAYISLCDVLDGDARRFEDLKRNVFTVQRECMLYERIKNALIRM